MVLVHLEYLVNQMGQLHLEVLENQRDLVSQRGLVSLVNQTVQQYLEYPVYLEYLVIQKDQFRLEDLEIQKDLLFLVYLVNPMVLVYLGDLVNQMVLGYLVLLGVQQYQYLLLLF
jgi:hypothetical protein